MRGRRGRLRRERERERDVGATRGEEDRRADIERMKKSMDGKKGRGTVQGKAREDEGGHR